MTQSSTLAPDPGLSAVGDAHAARVQAEVAEVLAVLDWAVSHEVADDETRTVVLRDYLRLGGEGCPVVAEDDAWDLACVLGRSPDSCAGYVGELLELRHRLPRLFARVVDLEVPVWRALVIARKTIELTLPAAGWVDRQLAGFAHTCSRAQVDRTVASALVLFDPDEANRRREAAEDTRRFEVHLHGTDTTMLAGTVEVSGTLDLADALDLDRAVTRTAAQLKDLGSLEGLSARRACAVGEIARAQLALDLETGESESGGAGRGVTIYAHLDATGVAVIQAGQTPVMVDQLLQWCTRPGVSVTVKPVIDLTQNLQSTGYAPSPRVREQVELRDTRCVFPFCQRRRTDLDHQIPYDQGGPTSSANLARLCRVHHRAKGRGRWTYEHLDPGRFRWTSPTGHTYLVDRTQ